MKRGIKKLHGKNKKLSSRFWVQLFTEFELVETCADSLPDPPAAEVPDADLVSMLEQAHHENPAFRKTAPLERYIEHAPLLNKCSVFGLLRAVMEGPTLPRTMATRCQVAVLRYFARTPPPPQEEFGALSSEELFESTWAPGAWSNEDRVSAKKPAA